VALPAALHAQTNYGPSGYEYLIAGTLPQDQVHGQTAVNASGGYLVWQDNIADGSGLGISALQLDSSFSGSLSSFRVNSTAANDQENPQVALLKNGGTVFAWQGGKQSYQHIYARFLASNKTWQANDILVNASTNYSQVTPAIAVLTNGNVIVIWSSIGQYSASSMQDVYGQILTSSGAKSGGEFLINQFTSYNQRTPAVAALSNGRFVVVWVSEQQRWTDASTMPSVDIYGRVYDVNGSAAGSEFLINTGTNICANPSVAGGADGGFIVAWSEKDTGVYTNGWDVFTRPYSAALAGGTVRRANTYQYGDQYAPKISASGTDYFVIWQSMGQDGSAEGVFGQVLHGDGAPWGTEKQINTTVINGQIQPAISSDGAGRFLVTWSGFNNAAARFDLYAQRFSQDAPPLPAMNAPFTYVPFTVVTNKYQPQIEVFWPAQSGVAIDHYEVYVDGSLTPAASVTTNLWWMTSASGLTAGTTHSFQVGYVTSESRKSPLSPASVASTWSGISYYGIPVEWMQQYWGDSWPPATAPLAQGGATPLQAFLTGANPLDPTTWLKTSLTRSEQGYYVNWNPQPGRTYQVQYSAALNGWTNLGSPRFAAGNTDSIYVGGSNLGYYRILCLH
jgi:hypothetical protein